MDPVERANFEMSSKRAQAAMTWVREHNGIAKDFKFNTGRWVWWPVTSDHVYHGWNATGGPASVVLHHVGYWLCLGWSSIEELAVTDPRAVAFKGASNGRA